MDNRFRFRTPVYGSDGKFKKFVYWNAIDGAPAISLANGEFVKLTEQCTGLKDKNGKLIYEGDLFELEEGVVDTVREVVWDKDTSSFKVSCRGKEEYNNGLYNDMREYEELLDLSLFLDCACIIGNIHESPELLEELK